MGQYIAEYLQSKTRIYHSNFFINRSGVTVFKFRLPRPTGGDVRQYLTGPPGPPGPPGVPGDSGDELVDDVANRVLSYIQSKHDC